MDLKGIISIAGMSGLYKIVATNKNGFIVESFNDKKRFAVSSAQRVSTLEDITIYTEDGDVPLKEVLKKLDENKDIKLDPKAEPEQMKKDLEVVLPDYDKERVYNSDIKKLFTWYTILKESDFSFEDEPEKESEEATEAEKETSETKNTKKTKKKTSKTAAKTEDKPAKKKKEKTDTKKSAPKAKSTKTKTKTTTKAKTAKTPASKKK